ncbi:Protocadherin-9 [Schistosoma japonicum]|nr:Protocadherin-9 [Schistosoma japonicum]
MFIVNYNKHIFNLYIFILYYIEFIYYYATIILIYMILLFKLDIYCWAMNTSIDDINIPKYVRIKLREESPSGTIVINIGGFLNSNSLVNYDNNANYKLNRRLSIVPSSLNLISEIPSVNRLFRLNKETQSIHTIVVIDRDTLCSKNQLCCSNPAIKNSINGYLDASAQMFVTNGGQTHKSYDSKTTEVCLIQFRVIFSTYYQHDFVGNGNYDQVDDITEKMAYITVEVEILDINDNSPQFILPIASNTGNMPKSVTLLYNPVTVIEISIEESLGLYSCIDLPKALDLDSSRYDVTEYRMESLTQSDILQLKHKFPNSNIFVVDQTDLPFSLEQKYCGDSLLPNNIEADINAVQQQTNEGFEAAINNELLIPSLKVINHLDRETVEYYWIKLLAVDGVKSLESEISNYQDIKSNKTASSSEHLLQIIRHTGTIMIRIHITDVNDNIPNVPRTLNLDISEDAKVGTLVGRINGTDSDVGDNGRLHYRLMMDQTAISNFPFLVDSLTGSITVNRPLDADRLPQLNKHLRFKVQTSDFGKPVSHSSYTAVDVRINDVNDETPQIRVIDLQSRSSPPYPTVMENKAPGQLVAFVTATDADSGPNGAISCRINNPKFKLEQIVMSASVSDTDSDNAINLYSFEPLTSQSLKQSLNTLDFKVITSTVLDRELSTIEAIEIMCIDQPLNSAMVRTGRTQFYVRILDENDNPPTFNTNKFQLDVLENIPPDEIIFVFNATDPDYENHLASENIFQFNEPSNHYGHHSQQRQNIIGSQLTDKIKYSIDSHGQQYLRIDAETGILYSKVKIDKKIVDKIKFNITAMDNGHPPKNVTAEVLINIIDQNDHAPQFEKQTFYFNLSEDLPVNSIAAILVAHDDDFGKNAEVTYKIDDLQGNAIKTFRLDRNNGSLWLRTPLDREKLDSYVFKVVAFDHGIPKQSSSCQVHIKVIDVNDNAPKFVYPTHSNHTVFASVFTNPGIPLVKLTATDSDEGLNSQLSFYLLDESNEKNIFTIDSNTGELSLLPTVDPYSIGGRYQVKFEVRDAGTPSLSGYANINIILDQNSPHLSSINKGKYHQTNMDFMHSRNNYRSPVLKNDNEIIHETNKEPNGIQSKQHNENSHIHESNYHQPMFSSSINSNDKYRRREKSIAMTNQKSSTQFSLEKMWIFVICLIAISTLIAFAFLVAITLARQKAATYELRQGSNHLTENFNPCRTDQCSSQFSVNTHRFTNVDNCYSPTKFQTLEKSDQKVNNNSSNCAIQDPNFYSPFVKYDTNTNSTTGSLHQLGLCNKEMSPINMDMKMHSKPVYNYNIPIVADSLQFPRFHNSNKADNQPTDKWISLTHVQHSAPASPNDYFSQRYKTIDQYQMNRNILNQKYELLQPNQYSTDEYNNNEKFVNQNLGNGKSFIW